MIRITINIPLSSNLLVLLFRMSLVLSMQNHRSDEFKAFIMIVLKSLPPPCPYTFGMHQKKQRFVLFLEVVKPKEIYRSIKIPYRNACWSVQQVCEWSRLQQWHGYCNVFHNSKVFIWNPLTIESDRAE